MAAALVRPGALQQPPTGCRTYWSAKVLLAVFVLLTLALTYLANLWTLEIYFRGYRRSPLSSAQNSVSVSNTTARQGEMTFTSGHSNVKEANSDWGRLNIKLHIAASNEENEEAVPSKLFSRPTTPGQEQHLLSIIPEVTSSDVNCARIIANEPDELKKASLYKMSHPVETVPDLHYVQAARDCGAFRANGKYVADPLSPEEADFPLAYSILMYRDVEQFERLLRAIYRPQNYYCVHVDLRSATIVHNAVRAMVRCFDNVFMASQQVPVGWGTFTVVEPELACMADLWKHKDWRYFINLTGQEFPLKTNWELVQILKAFNGANNIEGTLLRRNTDRTKYVHVGHEQTSFEKTSPPNYVRLTKGSVHIAAVRGFIDAILHDERVLEFIGWIKDTGIPDETIFSSLNHSPELGLPGSYKGVPETDDKSYPLFTRFKNWGVWPFDWPCHGKRAGLVCIFSTGDLPLLTQRPELFANKFHLDYDPLALTCLEEYHYNRTRQDILQKHKLDLSIYTEPDFIRNHF